jgi:iron(III) transport system ATP-binding protein
MPDITLSGVAKSYGGGGAQAVSNLDLVVREGAFMCLLGPSGCGKTTTLRMIAGLEHATEGRIAIGPRVVSSVDEGIFVPAERRQIGLVFQNYALWPHLTVAENVAFGLRLRGMGRVEREARIAEVLATIEIAELAARYPSQLSGGQQQRVALARTLAVSPDVLLMDEPLSNLDARLRLEMRAELKRLHSAFGTTIVFVTHDQWEAMTLATEIAVMNAGTLQQVGTPDDIYTRPGNRFVAEFVGNPPINMLHADPASGVFARIAAMLRNAAPDLLPATIGIRPEAITLQDTPADDQIGLPACVTGILPTGGSWILETRCEDVTLFALLHSPPGLSVGDAVTLAVPVGALHLFDADGMRMPVSDSLVSRRIKLGPSRAAARSAG